MDSRELLKKIETIAPGTPLRHALNDIQEANTGGLLVFIDGPEDCKDLMQPNFIINCPFSPNKLYELAKMDGAIVVTSDLSTIVSANVQLIPDSSIPTNQTGMRHRAAERMAKQTGRMLIAISKRRKTITIFMHDYVYAMSSLEVLSSKIAQTIRTVEKYHETFFGSLKELDILENSGLLTLYDVVKALQKALRILAIANEAKFTIAELGDQGRLPEMQLEEILEGIYEEVENLVLDFSYSISDIDAEEAFMDKFMSLTERELGSYTTLARTLGYEVSSSKLIDIPLKSRGIRFVRQVPRIPLQVAINVGKTFETLEILLESTDHDLRAVDGIGEKRASSIRHAIEVFKNRNDY